MIFSFAPGLLDFTPALRADAVHLLQPRAERPFDHVENSLAELMNQLFRVNRPDSLHHPASQILFDSLLRSRCAAFQKLCPKLQAKLTVPDPASLSRQPFARVDRRKRPDHGDLVALTLHLDLQNGKPVLLVEKRHAFDHAGKALGRNWGLCLQSNARNGLRAEMFCHAGHSP